MNCLVKISSFIDSTSQRQVPAQQFLVHIDSDLIQIPVGERPIDLVMELMTDVQSLSDASGILRPFYAVRKDGMSNMRSVVFPGGVQVQSLNPLFQARADHIIQIRMGDIAEGWSHRSAWISLDGGSELALTNRDLVRAGDRIVHKGLSIAPLFERHDTGNHDGKIRPDQVSSGGLLCGMFHALFEQTPTAPREDLTPDHAILAGLLAWKSGASFDLFNTMPGDSSKVVSAMTEQYQIFMTQGYVFSDRGWNPSRFLPGPRLAEARTQVEAKWLTIGAQLLAAMQNINPFTAHLVTRHLLETMGPISSWMLPDHPHVELSRHRRLQIETEAARLDELPLQ